MSVLHRLHRCPTKLLVRLAMATVTHGLVFAEENVSTADAGAVAKNHVLFMGADIAVEKDKEFHPVHDVTPSSLVIELNGKPAEVRQSRDVNLLIKESLKLALANATVENLVTERAYAPGSDPFRQIAQSAAFAAGETAVADLAQGEVLQANTMVMGANVVLEALRGTDIEYQGVAAVAQAEAVRSAAETNVAHAYNTSGGQIADVGARAADAGAQASQQQYDAIRLSFEVVSERDLPQPYFAVVAQIVEPGSKPGHARKWAYVKTLGALKAGEKKRVTVFQGGMPSGYAIESCEVHLYDRGSEIATNLSRKRVELTDDEALQFRIIEYVDANKGRTLPAAPAAAMPASARASLTPAQLSENCFVRVAKDGRVTDVYRDATGRKPLKDSALESVLKALRFKPALESGKPVDSIIAVIPGRLASS